MIISPAIQSKLDTSKTYYDRRRDIMVKPVRTEWWGQTVICLKEDSTEIKIDASEFLDGFVSIWWVIK